MKSGWVLRPGAAEFPHENALINRGALWIGTALCGAENTGVAKADRSEAPRARTQSTTAKPLPVPEASTVSVNPTAEGAPSSAIPRSTAASGATDASTGVTAPPSIASAPVAHDEPLADTAHDEKVEHFVRAIAEVARAHGAAETAAHAESLFKFGTPAPLELSDPARAALFEGNILEATEGGIHATAWFTRTSSAWQRMLRGEAENLAVCGESTLDGWTADLIACLVAKPNMASAIRRDLRRRGIAAFGMLDS